MIYLFSSLQVAHLGSVGFDYIANAPLLMVSSVSLDIKYLFFWWIPVFFLWGVVEGVLP